MDLSRFTWVECPRDAMQGMAHFIPTSQKIDYINHLIAVGFDEIDIGSFVSAKAIPQLKDSHEVINGVEWKKHKPNFLVIVANERGAEQACKEERVDTLGFPFSVSETFQLRNTSATQEESLKRLDGIFEMTQSAEKKLVIYLSMAFGNPYGDAYSTDIVLDWCQQLADRYPQSVFSLSDTVGAASPNQIESLYLKATENFPNLTLGLHLHAAPQDAMQKAQAALKSGCPRIDSALGGWGGCPMATNELTGNLDSAVLKELIYPNERYDWDAFQKAQIIANQLFKNA
jgi:hydroxymethylglutaryl-CoA lyase